MKIMFPIGCCLFNLISHSFKVDYFLMPIGRGAMWVYYVGSLFHRFDLLLVLFTLIFV